MNINHLLNPILGTLTLVVFLGLRPSVRAEIVPTNLPEVDSSQLSTQVINDQPTIVISGGTERGDNLFHIFEDFNVDTNEQVLFLNDASASRIFSLVTGSDSSRINGTLGIIGDGNLFLLNKNGINFGANAVLAIKGNFIATTADRIDFADGTTLSSDEIGRSPLLSSSIPVGLGFSSRDSAITVENMGHTLAGSGILPYVEESPKLGISVSPSRTLSLVGNALSLDGGILRAPDGLVSIGAVESGTASIESTPSGLDINYNDSSTLGKIELSNAALIDATGLRGGSIQVAGQNVEVIDRSVITTTGTLGDPIGRIEVLAERLYIDGKSTAQFDYNPETSPLVPLQILPASIISQSVGTSNGIDVEIQAEQIVLQNGGGITARGFELGTPGDVKVNARSVLLSGNQPQVEPFFSTINTISFSDTKDAGDIEINTDRLSLQEGALVTSSGFEDGQAGRIDIRAEEITVDGTTSESRVPSIIQVSGDGGDIEIYTGQLRVTNGGAVGSTAIGTDDSGSVRVEAREQVEVFSSVPNSRSGIGSAIAVAEGETVDLFGFTGESNGNAGTVSITTPSLIVGEGGSVSVENNGTGDSGSLVIAADTIKQLSSGRISAFTADGEGGDINITSDALLLTGLSSVDSSSSGGGSGGSIKIDSGVIALTENSRINANARQGSGGQVLIETEALLRAPTSSITATSAAGPQLDGVVEIQAPNNTSRTETDVVPASIEVPSIAVVCITGASESEFSVSGRGGRPLSAEDAQRNYTGWNPTPSSANVSSDYQSNQIVEAQGWISNGDGTVRFTDQISPAFTSSSAQNTATCVGDTGSQNRN